MASQPNLSQAQTEFTRRAGAGAASRLEDALTSGDWLASLSGGITAVVLMIAGVLWQEPVPEYESNSWIGTFNRVALFKDENAHKARPVIDVTIHDVAVVDGGSAVYAVGAGGLVVKSTDRGQSWQAFTVEARDASQANPPSGRDPLTDANLDLRVVAFADKKRGFVVGEGGRVFRTNDGETWTRAEASIGTPRQAVLFEDLSGAVVDSDGIARWTDDGGATWSDVKLAGGDSNGPAAKGEQNNAVQAPMYGELFVKRLLPGPRNSLKAITLDARLVDFDRASKSWRPLPSSPWDGKGQVLTAGILADQRVWILTIDSRFAVYDPVSNAWTGSSPGDSMKPERAVDAVVVDDDAVYVLGEYGTLLRGNVKGEPWVVAGSAPGSRIVSAKKAWNIRLWTTANDLLIAFGPATENGRTGDFALSGDYGQDWFPIGRPIFETLAFPRPGEGWGFERNGFFLWTDDDGRRWNPVKRLTGMQRHGWSVHATDRGRSGVLVSPEVKERTERGSGPLASKAFLFDFEARSLQEVKSNPSFANWPPLGYAREAKLAGAAASWGQESRLWLGPLNGDSWQPKGTTVKDLTPGGSPVEIRPGSPRELWRSGGEPPIAWSADDGATWTPVTVPPESKSGLYNFQFTGASEVWAVPASGSPILRCSSVNSSAAVSSLGAALGERARSRIWIGGEKTAYVPDKVETVLVTRDGGASWAPLSPGQPRRRFTWTFYLVSIPFIGYGAFFYVKHRINKRREVKEREGIDEMAVCDLPVKQKSQDALAFSTLTESLALFLRNRNTEAPLTIAIEGEWGSGKSSMMNLLETELKDAGFTTVWFNAWHHQTEEHLLVSLLGHIRDHAAIPWFDLRKFRGPLFFVKLWTSRLVDHVKGAPVRTLGLVFVFFLAAFYIAAVGPAKIGSSIVTFLTSWIPSQEKGGAAAQPDSWETILAFLTTSGFLAGLVPALRSVRAFVANPADLVTSLVKRGRAASAEAQTSFRARFARDFKEVTDALGRDTKLAIFVDDLDRCAPASAVEILQSVNYLTTAGKCVVVLGFDRDYVKACIRGQYQHLIEHLPSSGLGAGRRAEIAPGEAFLDLSDAAPVAPASENDFAAHYLQKLVNISIAVPRSTPEQLGSLLRGADRGGAVILPWWKRAWKSFAAGGWKGFAAAAVLLSTAYAAWSLAHRLAPASAATAAAALAESQPARVLTASGPAVEAVKPNQTPAAAAAPPADPPLADLVGGESRTVWPAIFESLLGLGAFLLLTYVGTRVIKPLPKPITDTAKFRDARIGFSGLLYADRLTPREVKRFINRVRYLAMKQRVLAKRETHVPDDALVALAAIERTHPEWLESPSFRADAVKFLTDPAAGVPESVREFVDDWPGAAALPSHVDAYRKLAQLQDLGS